MKECKICKTQNEDKDEICKYCGCYLGFVKFHKFLLISLFIWILLPYAIYLAIKDNLKMQKIRQENNINIKDLILNNQSARADIENLQPFLCDVTKLRKKDGNIVRGDCNFAFNENLFIISQGDEKIENEIDSIYYFDIWEYEDETYFKICMRSHTEYKFKSIHFEADKISDYLKTKGIKIEDNRN